MSAVFISYRRVGAIVHARALFERLTREFGPSQVFIDLDGIEIGVDFVDLIERQLRGCRIVLALVDPEWATARDRSGRRRIDRDDDFVRLEIATALRRGIHVAPILIDGAEMPEAAALPDDLKPLTRRQALELDFRRFDPEVGRLVEVIRRLLSKPPSPPEPAAAEQRLEARGPAVQSSPATAESTPEPTFVETDLSADPPDLEPHAADGESNRWRLAAIAATVVGTVVLVAALLNVPSGGVPDRGSSEPPAAAAPAPQAAPAKREVDVSQAGTLTGRVLFEGPVPGTPQVRMAADPVCIRVNPDGRITEEFAVSDGGLENVFVYIKSGLDPYEFTLPTRPVTVEMKGCGYVPHVFGVRAGQPIEFANGDPTLHAVRARPNVNAEFVFGHPIQGMRTAQTFTSPEVPVTITCDIHSWEKAYAGVVAHPYFAVTSGGGRFELKDVPAGTYTIEAVHEKLGSQTQSVTFGERDTKEVVFTFKSPS